MLKVVSRVEEEWLYLSLGKEVFVLGLRRRMKGVNVIFVVLLGCLIAAAQGQTCQQLWKKPPQTQIACSSWVYNVIVFRIVPTPRGIDYDVRVVGILKKRSGRPAIKYDFVGSRVTIQNPLNRFKKQIESGMYMVMGGRITTRGAKTISPIGFAINLGKSKSALPPCPESCEKWYDGGNDFQCDGFGTVLGSTDNFPREYGRSQCNEFLQLCPKDCKMYFDGCNTCICNDDGSMGGCTRKACLVLEEPKCVQFKTRCVLCPAVLPQCPDACPDNCEYNEPGCFSCGNTFCPKPRATYYCDPFSTWSSSETRNCMRSNGWKKLPCQRADCRRDPAGLPRREMKKIRYCRSYPGCTEA